MSYSDAPTREDISRLLDTLRRRIVAIFVEFNVPETDAVTLVCDGLVRLGYRWGRIRDREGWLLNWLRARARAYARARGTGKEMDDDGAPPRPEE
jgi:hypothetical protein